MKKEVIAGALLAVSGATPVLAQEQGEFEVYGFAMFDFIQDFNRVNPDWNATLRASRIPTTDGLYGSDGETILSVRQSRLGVKADMPVGDETLSTVFEFDLFGVGDDAGQTTMRVRHAYGKWGKWLAGQTNTLFMDNNMFPNVIDYWGPSGMTFIRNAQIRYTPFEGQKTLAFAFEQPGHDIDTGALGRLGLTDNVQGHQALPDLTMQYNSQADWGHWQLAGIWRDIRYESVGTPDNEPKGSDMGWGLSASGNIKVPTGTVRLQYVQGEGIASYMNDGGMDMAPALGSVADPIEANAVPIYGAVAYYEHGWNAQWTSTIGYGITEVDNQNLQTADTYKKGEYASVNLLHTPAENVLVGGELMWGQRTDKGGASGEDVRVQFSVKYNFSSKTVF